MRQGGLSPRLANSLKLTMLMTFLTQCICKCLQVVVSDKPGCGGCIYAQEHGIPTVTFPTSKASPGTSVSLEELLHTFQSQYGVDYVLLAGYIKVCRSACQMLDHKTLQ